VLCKLLVVVEVTYLRVLGVLDAEVVCVGSIRGFGGEDEWLLEGVVIVAIGILLVSSDEEVVTASDGVLDAVSDALMYIRGVEETSGSHDVADTVTVSDRDSDGTDDCDISVVGVTVSIVLLFSDGDE
jgi:hypothetical protein